MIVLHYLESYKKNVTKSSAVWSVAHYVCQSRPSRDNNECHSDWRRTSTAHQQLVPVCLLFWRWRSNWRLRRINPLLAIGSRAHLPILAFEWPTVSARRPTFGIKPWQQTATAMSDVMEWSKPIGNTPQDSVIRHEQLINVGIFWDGCYSSLSSIMRRPAASHALTSSRWWRAQPQVEWVSEYGLTSTSTHYKSFRRRVFPVNHLHWYWQPNKNNQLTEYTNNTK